MNSDFPTFHVDYIIRELLRDNESTRNGSIVSSLKIFGSMLKEAGIADYENSDDGSVKIVFINGSQLIISDKNDRSRYFIKRKYDDCGRDNQKIRSLLSSLIVNTITQPEKYNYIKDLSKAVYDRLDPDKAQSIHKVTQAFYTEYRIECPEITRYIASLNNTSEKIAWLLIIACFPAIETIESCDNRCINYLNSEIIPNLLSLGLIPEAKNINSTGPHSDVTRYQEAFKKSLFLENGENKASVRDVFIEPRIKQNSLNIKILQSLKPFLDSTDYAQRVMFIYGSPGSGKSTFVSFLSTNPLCMDIPFHFVCLRNMTEAQINDDSPLEGVLKYIHGQFEDLFNSVLVLDGLDEICALYSQSNMCTYLGKLYEEGTKIQGLKIIITSRPGYFSLNEKLKNFFSIVELTNWEKDDLYEWRDKYTKVHPESIEVITKNIQHLLTDAELDKKKTMFSVPILFYMANAKNLLIENYGTVCALYDAVFSNVLDERLYDPTLNRNMDATISPKLARQICREIAYSMFKYGRLGFLSLNDPYLIPQEVSDAIELAVKKVGDTEKILSASDKNRIKEMFTLTFFYNINDDSKNAVEFAHKSIAEYFIAEKITEILVNTSSALTNSDDTSVSYRSKLLASALISCFGYTSISEEICIFLNEKLRQKDAELISLKENLEQSFYSIIKSESLLDKPQDAEGLAYFDRASIMLRSMLLLIEYLNCHVDKQRATEISIDYYSHFLANVARIQLYNKNFGIPLTLHLNGFDLAEGKFKNCDFSEAHLSGSNLTSASFEDSVLNDVSFYGSNLTNCDLSGAKLQNAYFVQLTGIDGAELTEAKMNYATIESVVFTRCSFEDADLSNATFTDCSFDEKSSIERATLYSTQFQNVDISKMIIEEIYFDSENEDDEGEAIWENVKMTKSQYEMLSNMEGIQLITPIIIDE